MWVAATKSAPVLENRAPLSSKAMCIECCGTIISYSYVTIIFILAAGGDKCAITPGVRANTMPISRELRTTELLN